MTICDLGGDHTARLRCRSWQVIAEETDKCGKVVKIAAVRRN